MRLRPQNFLTAVPILFLFTLPIAAVEILTVDDLQPGMTGVGYTVWEGAEIEPFDVEILGVLRNYSPGRHLILAEAHGPQVEEAGIPGGISGSPVYIDGKLVGACAFTWSFTKKPVMGIQPIEYMLDLMIREEEGRPSRMQGADPAATRHLDLPPFDPVAIHRLASGAEPVFLEPMRRLRRASTSPGDLAPIPVALSVSGVPANVLQPMADVLTDLGMVPATTSGIQDADSLDADTSLRPGASVGAALVRGDLRMDAFGTVTHVAGDHVFAFGHPFFGMGSVDYPMSEGWVLTVLPRQSSSFKMISHVRDTGVIRQDRGSGIYGRLGETPDMLPLDLELERGDGAVEKHSLELIRDPVLTPLLAYISLQSLLASAEKDGGGAATIELLEDSFIQMNGHGSVRIDNFYSGPSAEAEVSGAIASYIAWILNNEFERPEVQGIKLRLRYNEGLQTATIRRVQFGKASARPGETVPLEIQLQPFRGEARNETVDLELPRDLPVGKFTLTVGSAAALDNLVTVSRGASLGSLQGLLDLIQGMRRNARLYVQLSQERESLLLDGEVLPNLPPTMEAMLRNRRVQGASAVFSRSELLEEEITLPFRVEGLQRATIEIRED